MQPPTPKNQEWRSLALNPATDIPLYRSPRNKPADNARLHRGTDLLVHKSASNTVYFYLWHWSMCENETDILQLTTPDSAKHYIREKVCDLTREHKTSGRSGDGAVLGLEHKHLMEYLPGLYWDVDEVHPE